MRNRINSGLVATTSNSLTKKRFIKKNKTLQKKYIVTIFGKTKEITKEQYDTLKEVGINVQIVER